MQDRTNSDNLSIPEVPQVARPSLPSTAEGEEPLTFSGRRYGSAPVLSEPTIVVLRLDGRRDTHVQYIMAG